MPNLNQTGYANLFLLAAVVGVVALIAVSNAHIFTSTNPDGDVKGVLVARSGQDQGNDLDFSGGSLNNSRLPPESGGSGSSNSGPGSSGGTSGSPTTGTDKKVEEMKMEQAKKEVEVRKETDKKEEGHGAKEQGRIREASRAAEVEREIENEISGRDTQKVVFKNVGGALEAEVHQATGSSKLLSNRGPGEAGEVKVKLMTKNGREVEIRTAGNEFKLTVKGKGVSTNFPITFDKTTGRLFVQTGNGLKEIRVLPDQATEIARTAGIQNQVGQVELINSGGQLVFKFEGTKAGKLLGLFPRQTDIEAEVAAQTGQVTTREPGSLLNRLLNALTL